MAAGRALEMTGASDKETTNERGPAGAWAGCHVRAKAGGGGAGAEAASIFLHEDDIDRGAAKRMACQNK